MHLSFLSLRNFKNHGEKAFSCGQKNVIYGPNGSGKTNILESIYFVINAIPPQGRTLPQLQLFGESAFQIASKIDKEGLEYDLRVHYDAIHKKTTFYVQKQLVTKPKYISSLNIRAVLFTPMEMNVLYLGPSLRRDFFDETLALAYPSFQKVKRDYQEILKNRNALLKRIEEGKASKGDLDYWDRMLAKSADSYYQYRKKLLDYIMDRISFFEGLLENKYKLKFHYETKVDFSHIEESILSYLQEKRERDIITGHTYIGPHLDDFGFLLCHDGSETPTEECLSRGENKTILLALKFLQIEFLKKTANCSIILLFDDLFSELDENHIKLVLGECQSDQLFITGQSLPEFIQETALFHEIKLN